MYWNLPDLDDELLLRRPSINPGQGLQLFYPKEVVYAKTMSL